MSTSKANPRKPNKDDEIKIEEIEEIIREEVPTYINNFITDAKYAMTGKDKYNRDLGAGSQKILGVK